MSKGLLGASKVFASCSGLDGDEKLRVSKRSHRQLENPNYPYEFTWAFHDGEEIGPVCLPASPNEQD